MLLLYLSIGTAIPSQVSGGAALRILLQMSAAVFETSLTTSLKVTVVSGSLMEHEGGLFVVHAVRDVILKSPQKTSTFPFSSHPSHQLGTDPQEALNRVNMPLHRFPAFSSFCASSASERIR